MSESIEIVDQSHIENYGIDLILTSGCNCQCPYCYQGSHPSCTMMTKEIANHVICKALQEPEFNHEIEFFGGEPTLNMDVIEFCMSKFPNMKYFITTNGNFMNLTEYQQNIFWNINHINISIEGFFEGEKNIRKIPDIDEFFHYIVTHMRHTVVFCIVITNDCVSHKEDFLSICNTVLYMKEKGFDVDLLLTEHISHQDNIDSIKEFESFLYWIKERNLILYLHLIRFKPTFVMRMAEKTDRTKISCYLEYTITVQPDGRLIPCTNFFQYEFMLDEVDFYNTKKPYYQIWLEHIQKYSVCTPKEMNEITHCDTCEIQNGYNCVLCYNTLHNLCKVQEYDTIHRICELQRIKHRHRIQAMEYGYPMVGDDLDFFLQDPESYLPDYIPVSITKLIQEVKYGHRETRI